MKTPFLSIFFRITCIFLLNLTYAKASQTPQPTTMYDILDSMKVNVFYGNYTPTDKNTQKLFGKRWLHFGINCKTESDLNGTHPVFFFDILHKKRSNDLSEEKKSNSENSNLLSFFSCMPSIGFSHSIGSDTSRIQLYSCIGPRIDLYQSETSQFQLGWHLNFGLGVNIKKLITFEASYHLGSKIEEVNIDGFRISIQARLLESKHITG